MSLHIPEPDIRHCKHLVFLFSVIVLLMISIDLSYAENKVVLIAAKGSGIESISNRDLRRVFLGLKSVDSELINRPVINLNNKEVYEEFLKNVMHMTEGSYKRKLVKRIFRNGAEEIKEVEILNELNAHLTSNVGDISFVENTVVDKMTDIEVIKVLW
jgi:hypothetical protein